MRGVTDRRERGRGRVHAVEVADTAGNRFEAQKPVGPTCVLAEPGLVNSWYSFAVILYVEIAIKNCFGNF